MQRRISPGGITFQGVAQVYRKPLFVFQTTFKGLAKDFQSTFKPLSKYFLIALQVRSKSF